MFFHIRPELIFHNRYVLCGAVVALLGGSVMLWTAVSSTVKTQYLLSKGIPVQAKVAERRTLMSKGGVVGYRLRLIYRVPGRPHYHEYHLAVGKKQFDATAPRSSVALKVHPKDHTKAIPDGKNPHILPATAYALLTFGSIYYLWGWHKYTDIVGIGARPDLDPHVKSFHGL